MQSHYTTGQCNNKHNNVFRERVIERERERERETDGRTDGQTDRQTEFEVEDYVVVELFSAISGRGRPRVRSRNETGGGEPAAAGPDLRGDHHRRLRQPAAEVPRRSPGVATGGHLLAAPRPLLLHHRLARRVSDRLVREQPVPAQGSGDEVAAGGRRSGGQDG